MLRDGSQAQEVHATYRGNQKMGNTKTMETRKLGASRLGRNTRELLEMKKIF